MPMKDKLLKEVMDQLFYGTRPNGKIFLYQVEFSTIPRKFEIDKQNN